MIDTHVLVWLYQRQGRRLPGVVERRLNREQLGLSPFVKLELGYLNEIGRFRPPMRTAIDELSSRLGMISADVAASAVCEAAIGITWTRDPFDRLISAHAIASNLTLVTGDETIRQHLPLAWWAD